MKFNSRTQDLDFYPSLYLQTLRDQLAFQEAVLQTQLFVGLIDKVRTAQTCLADRQRLFLYDWLRYRMHVKATTKTIAKT